MAAWIEWLKTMPRQLRAGAGHYSTRCATARQGESLDVAETFNWLKYIMPRFFDSGRCQRQHEVEPGISLWPREVTFDAYVYVFVSTKIGVWYLNSLVTSVMVTVLVVAMAATCGYAISQLKFPGRSLLWWLILGSFMVPVQALIVNHFVLASQFGLATSGCGGFINQSLAL